VNKVDLFAIHDPKVKDYWLYQ